jgi:hypothetical protein
MKNGRRLHMAAWAEHFGVCRQAVFRRIKLYGWSECVTHFLNRKLPLAS